MLLKERIFAGGREVKLNVGAGAKKQTTNGNDESNDKKQKDKTRPVW